MSLIKQVITLTDLEKAAIDELMHHNVDIKLLAMVVVMGRCDTLSDVALMYDPMRVAISSYLTR